MGIADRDYTKDDPGRGGAGGYARAGQGLEGGRGWRGWRVTTVLIVINVAVFVAQQSIFSQSRPLTYYGKGYYPWASPAAIERGVVDTSVPYQDAKTGLAYFEIRDPKDPVGFDAQGKPVGKEIGAWRFVTYMDWLQSWGHFSTGRAFSDGELWRFVTFQFLHANLMHIVLNMYALWMFGSLVEDYLGRRRFLAFYLVCGSCGALLYLILNLAGYLLNVQIPGVLSHDPYMPLVGASAGVFGVLLASAFISPDEKLVLFPIPISMRLKTFAYGYTLLALVSLIIGTNNAGGEAAHLGGAIAGAWLIRRVDILRDIADFFDVFSSGKDKEKKSTRRERGERGRGGNGGGPTARQEAAIDAILAKVSASGLESLSEAEKTTLRQATRGR